MSKIKNLYQLLQTAYGKYVRILEKYLSSVLLLAIRIWIGLVFFKSGLVKLSNIDYAIMLFTYEYSLPFVPPILATIIAMTFELACGLCIILGLLTRITALPLIGMTLVIQLLVFQNQEHFYWLFLLSVLSVYGSGKISSDYVIKK
ncbi:MAG: putative oxidoreductase [Candidatus Deianiraeaceae bacterium]|jgi:putative oxidoreductase